jgi:hypothetical protein
MFLSLPPSDGKLEVNFAQPSYRNFILLVYKNMASINLRTFLTSIYYRAKFQKTTLSGASVAFISEFRTATILVLFAKGN